MSGAVKHMERSHKTRNKNYSEFRKSAIRNSNNSVSRKLIRETISKSVFGRLLNVFNHQDR